MRTFIKIGLICVLLVAVSQAICMGSAPGGSGNSGNGDKIAAAALVKFYIDPAQTVQTMTAWGASEANVPDGAFKSLGQMWQDSILNLCYGPAGAAMNAFRTQIDPRWDYGADVWKDTFDADQWWIMSQLQNRGPVTFFAEPWSPPGVFKANYKAAPAKLPDTSNYLLPAYYDSYTNYLSGYVDGYKKYRNISIGWLSVQNEPDRSWLGNSCQYSPAQLTDFMTALGDKLTQDHVNVNILAPDCFGYNAANQYLTAIAAAPDAAKYLAGFATQSYGASSNRKTVAAAANAMGLREIWQTELGDTSAPTSPADDIANASKIALNIQSELVDGNVTALFFKWLVTFSPTDGQGLLRFAGDTLIIPKRFWAFAQFSRFIKPGYRRVAVAGTATQIKMVAFVSPHNDSLVVVAINNTGNTGNDILLALPDLCDLEYTAYRWRMSSTEDLAYDGTVESIDSKIQDGIQLNSINTYVIPLITNPNQIDISQTSPANGASALDNQQTLSWAPYEEANRYRVIVAKDTTLQTIVIDTTVIGTSLDYTFQPSTRYWWKVKGLQFTQTIACSGVWRFSTIYSAPDSVRLLRPVDSLSAIVDSLRFTWRKAVRDPDFYELDLGKDPALTNPSIYAQVYDTTLLVHNLEPFTEYWWRVKAHNEGGFGPFSLVYYFKTQGPNDVMDQRQTTAGFDFDISPDPAGESISVTLHCAASANAAAFITIYDNRGMPALVLIPAATDDGVKSEISLKALGSGVYYLRYELGGDSLVRKFVIVK